MIGLLLCGTAVRAANQDATDAAPQGAWTNRLAQEVHERRDAFRPIPSDRIATARQRVQQALQELDHFFQYTSRDNRANWRTFLKWDALEQELATDGVPSLGRLAASYNQFVSGEPGLELAPFLRVRESLRTLVERMRLTESEANRVSEERQRLERVVQEFGRFLASGGERKERGWRKYLELDDLESALAQDEPDSRTLRRVLARLDGDVPGLQDRRFQRLAQALRKYEEVRQLSQRPGGSELFQARMNQLAAAIEEYSKTRSNDSAATITTIAHWLTQIEQQSDLAQRLRDSFSRPNLSVWVSAGLVERELHDRVCSCEPVCTCFEGANVTGIANSNSCIQGHLLPSNRHALIEIAIGSMIVTDSIAQKRRVYVSSESHTQVAARKLLILSEDGLVDIPAQITACTRQYPRGICVDRRVGRRLIARGARRRAAESKMRAQCFTSRNTINSASTRLNRQSREMAVKANAQIAEMKQALRSQRLYPETVSISSTATHLWLQAVGRDAQSFATTTDPPPIPFMGDVGIQIHQSAINNAAKQLLGGRKIDSDSVVEMMQEYDMEVPEELLAGAKPQANGEPGEVDPDEKWSLTFDSELPVSVTFADGNVQIGIRGRKFSRGERQVNERIEIAATYRLLRSDDGHLVAEKVGELDVRFVDQPGRLSTSQMSYKVFLKRKFESLFRDQLTTHELEKVPNARRLQDLMVDAISTGAGWVSANVSVRPGVQLRRPS